MITRFTIGLVNNFSWIVGGQGTLNKDRQLYGTEGKNGCHVLVNFRILCNVSLGP